MNVASAELDGGVLRVMLERPDKLNAVNTPMLGELAGRLGDAAGDEPVRVVLLTGAGRALGGGSDLTGRDTDGAAAAANEVSAGDRGTAQAGRGRRARTGGGFWLPARVGV
ncbi:hypothetical protein MINTM019_28700 [Mycobacterium paraintracellulare]|nr:hypothetical protein MINTM019_28700 [Mycobacterium paraintracellulare]